MRRAFLVLAVAALEAAASSVTLVPSDRGFATGMPAYGRAVGWQAVSDLEVVNGTTYIAWYDDGPPTQRGMISRISSEGALLDPVGRPAGGFSTRLVPDGDDVLLYWVDFTENERVLVSQRFGSDGMVTPIEEILRFFAEPFNAGFDAVRGPSGLTLAAIGPHLALLDGSRVVRQRTLAGWGQPTIVIPHGDGWIVAWVASGGFAMWEALDANLQSIGPAGGSAVTDGAGSTIDIVPAGTTFLYAVSGQIGLDVFRVDPAGGTSVRIVELDVAFVRPVLTRLGENRFLLAWAANGRIEGAEIAGDQIGPALVLSDGGGFDFEILPWDDGYVVVESLGGCFRTICEFDVVATLSRGGTSTSLVVSLAAARQFSPSLATDGTTWIAGWRQREDGALGGSNVVGWGVSRGDRFDVHRFAADRPLSRPEVGAFGGNAIVLWTSLSLETLQPVFEGYVLDGNGAPVTKIVLPHGLEPQLPAVTGGPDGWLVTWFEWVNGPGRIAAMRVGFDGRPLGEPIIIGAAESLQFSTTLEPDSGDFVFTWVDRDESTGPYRLRVSRLTRTGQVVSGNIPASSEAFLLDPSIECSGGRCLVLWCEDTDEETYEYDVKGIMIDASGLTARSQTFTVAESPLVEDEPIAARTTDAWVVTWTERDPNGSESTVRAIRLEDAPVAPVTSIEVAIAAFADDTNHALACAGETCLSLQVRSVDDVVRGRTFQLGGTDLTSSRRHGVRRGE